MEALMEIQPEFLVWRSPTKPFPRAQGHLKHSPEKLLAGLSSCLEGPNMGISSNQRARRDLPYVHSNKGPSEGPASDPRPGSWPVFNTKHSEGPQCSHQLRHLGL